MTILTGTIRDAGGNLLSLGYMTMRLSSGANLLPGGCGGPMVVEQLTQIFKIVNGAITEQNGVVTANPSVYGTDCLSPAGLWYEWTIYDADDGLLSYRKVYITGASVDLGTVVDISGLGTIPASTTLAGDVIGTTLATSVVKLQGRALSANAPADDNVIAWDAGISQWVPADLTGLLWGAGAWGSGGVVTVAGPIVTALPDASVIITDPSGGAITLNLPQATGSGRLALVFNSFSGSTTLQAFAGDIVSVPGTFNGAGYDIQNTLGQNVWISDLVVGAWVVTGTSGYAGRMPTGDATKVVSASGAGAAGRIAWWDGTGNMGYAASTSETDGELTVMRTTTGGGATTQAFAAHINTAENAPTRTRIGANAGTYLAAGANLLSTWAFVDQSWADAATTDGHHVSFFANPQSAGGASVAKAVALVELLNGAPGTPIRTGIFLGSADWGLADIPASAYAIYTKGTRPTFLGGILELATTSSTAGQVKVNAIRALDWYGTRNIVLGSPDAAASNITNTASDSTIIGAGAGTSLTSGSSNVMVGAYTGTATAIAGVLVPTALTTGGNNILLGYGACVTSASAASRIAIGNGAVCAVDLAAVIGGFSIPYLQIGTDSSTASTYPREIRAASARGLVDTDTLGSPLYVEAGRSTGAGAPPSILFRTTDPVASGTGFQTYQTRLTISNTRITAALPTILTGFSWSVTAVKTGNYTTTASDGTVRCDPSGGGFTITLDSTAAMTNQVYCIKNTTTSTNTITVTPSSGTIDGAASATMTTARASLMCQFDGTNWMVI